MLNLFAMTSIAATADPIPMALPNIKAIKVPTIFLAVVLNCSPRLI
jgi:hypothetical protein